VGGDDLAGRPQDDCNAKIWFCLSSSSVGSKLIIAHSCLLLLFVLSMSVHVVAAAMRYPEVQCL